MKKACLFLLMVLVFGSSPAWAQKVEIAPFYGYQFGGGLDVVRGSLSLPASGALTMPHPSASPCSLRFFRYRNGLEKTGTTWTNFNRG